MALFNVPQVPPWLIPQRPLSESLLRGVEAGSMIRRNQIATKELLMREEAQLTAKENQARLQEGLLAFGKYMGSVEDWSSPEAESGALKIAARYPWITSTPAFSQGMQNFANARSMKSASVLADWLGKYAYEDNTVVSADLPTDPVAAVTAMKYKESAKQRLSMIGRAADGGFAPSMKEREFEFIKRLESSEDPTDKDLAARLRKRMGQVSGGDEMFADKERHRLISKVNDLNLKLSAERAKQVPDQDTVDALAKEIETAQLEIARLSRHDPSDVDGENPKPIPADAVDFLKKNPHLRKKFDEKYGEGAAAAILGQ